MKKKYIFVLILLLSFFIIGNIYYKYDDLRKNRFFYAYFEIKKEVLKSENPDNLTKKILEKYKIKESEWRKFLKQINKNPEELFLFLKQGG